DLLKILVLNRLDVNQEDRHGNTPVVYAIEARECQILDYLFKCGANIFQKDDHGQTFLSYAFSSSQPAIVNYLIHCGADIQSLVNNPKTVIMIIYNRSLDLLKILVAKHLNINIMDENGNTPLVYAIKALDEQIVDYLIECGADIHSVNYEG
ncbi:hypothetical protein PIROE2DRAFT_26859, partial [Piromyces sp. E2]